MELAPPPGADDVVTARLEDDLDASTAPHVAELLRSVVRSGSRVVLDMRAVPFMDCAGLSEILRAHRRAVAGGGWVRLVSLQAGPRLVLELTQTLELLTGPGIPVQRPAPEGVVAPDG